MDPLIAGSWLALLVLTQAGRLGLWLGYRRAAESGIKDASAWLRRFRWAAIGTGLLWGFATWWLFPDELINQVFMAFVLGGLSAGTITNLAPDRPSALGFVICALGPLILNFLIQGSGMALAMGAMIALFLLFVALSGMQLRQLLLHNETLVREAREQQNALEAQQQLAEAITRAQSRFINIAERRQAFDELLTDILGFTGSEYGFIGEVLHTPEGIPYLKSYAITNIAWNDETRALYEQYASQGMEFFNLKTLFGRALTSGEPVIANDPYHDPRRGGLPAGHPSLNAFLGIPIHHGNQLVAMLGIANRPGGYDQALVDYLAPLLATIGQLVTVARVQQQRRKDLLELERLSRVASQTTNGVVITDTEGRVEWTNQGFTRLTGYTLDELRGHKPGALLQGADTDPATVAQMRSALHRGEGFDVDLVNYTKDAKPYWVRLQCTPLHDASGSLQGFMAIESDVTREKEDAEQVRASERRLASVIEGTNIGTWEWNVQTGETVFNARWAEMVGYSLDELAPTSIQTWMNLAHPEDLAQSGMLLERHFAGELDFYDCMARMRHKDGHWVWVHDRGRVVTRTADGKPLLMSGTHADITAQKQAEQALRDSEQQYRSLVNNIPGITYRCLLDEHWTMLYMSDKMDPLSGYPASDFIGNAVRSYASVIHPEDRQMTDEAVHEALRVGTDRWTIEYRIMHRDGSIRWAHEQGSAVRDDGGRPLYLDGFILDITQSKHASQALQASEARLRGLFELSPLGIALNDYETGAFIDLNEALLRPTGYGREEFVALSYWDITPREYEPQEVQQLEIMEKTGRYGPYEKEYFRKDGSRYPVLLNGLVVYDNSGRKLIWSIIEDISERKQAEMALLEQARHTQTILDNIVDGIITIDMNGVMQSINPAARRIFAYADDEMSGQNVSMLMPNPHREAHDGYLRNYQSTGVARIIGIGREVEGRRKDGSLFPMELAVSEITQHGKPLYVGMLRDISERKRMERMKSEFVSTVSHELRTPLTSISGALSLIAGGGLGKMSEQAQQMISIAHKNSQRLTHLINDLLDMEKIAAGKMHFEMQVQPLAPLIAQALESHRNYGAGQQVELLLDGAATDVEVRVDSQRLQQVLANLLSNAIKFSPAASTVRVSVQPMPGQVRVTVTDQGPGIPKAFRTRIFEKFSQADSSDTRKKGGTGLGLAITRELVARMGGRIGFDSVEGEGASFWFELPLFGADQVTRVVEGSAVARSNTPRILVVEDEPDVAEVLASLLIRSGYQVDVAYTGEQALTALANTVYAAMSLDLILPDISGLAIIQRVRRQPHTANLPIMIVSARLEEGRLAINGDFSGIEWLAKPIDEQQLLQTVEALLEATATNPARVLHVEDDGDLHQVIRTMAGARFDFEQATSLREARERIALERFDVVILDIGLPDGSGWDLLAEIRVLQPEVRVLILSGTDMTPDEARKVEAVLLKSQVSPRALLDALSRRVQHQTPGNGT